jgi:hypothetical protein
MSEDQGLPIARAGFIRAAAVGAQTLALTGDHDTDAGALAKVLDGDAPGLVLDFVWGAVAETAFAALTRRGAEEDSADIKYVQIGALAGPEAAVPSSLLRSRKLTISGSGAGSVGAADIKAQIPVYPVYLELITSGSVQVPFPDLPAVRRQRGLDRIRRNRPARSPHPRLGS